MSRGIRMFEVIIVFKHSKVFFIPIVVQDPDFTQILQMACLRTTHLHLILSDPGYYNVTVYKLSTF